MKVLLTNEGKPKGNDIECSLDEVVTMPAKFEGYQQQALDLEQ